MLDYVLYIFMGFGIGAVAGLLGIGGGFLLVPLLTLTGTPIHIAIGTSISCIIAGSLASSYSHYRKGRVLFKVAILNALVSLPFAVLGSYATGFFNSSELSLAFSAVLFYAAFKMAKNKTRPKNEQCSKSKIDYRRVSIVGALAGSVSGFFGIGGGVVRVPLFFSFIGIPMHYAIATSSFSIFFTAAAGSLSHYAMGQVDVIKVALIAPAMIAGGYIGAKITHKVNQKNLKRWFSVVMAVISAMMVLKTAGLL